jgi:peptidoglycan hydrolase-like protein with peptidoglycan-binding domain
MTKRNVTFLLLLSLAGTGTIRADEDVRSTQEELRRRNVYFGDIDGRHTPELEEALKRFQHRKGLAPSGREDEPTLRTLGLRRRSPDEPPPKELTWPDEPVLKSDMKIDIPTAVKELAAEGGVAPSAVAPVSVLTTPVGSPGSRGKSGSRKQAGQRQAPGQRTAEQPAPAPIAAQHSITPQETVAYLKGYLDAMEHGDLKNEMAYFADRVNYYSNGPIDRRIVEFALRRYQAQWPSRDYKLERVLGYSRNPRTAEITVSYEVKFTLKHRGAKAQGRTLNQIVINAATAAPRIVAIRETRLRD